MNSKNSDCILKACVITGGILLLFVCMFLYLGDDCMRKCIEANILTKIILITTIGLLIVIAIGIIVGIWFCKQNICFNDYRDFLPVYDSGVVVVQKKKNSYTVTQYNTLEKYVDNASDDDIVYMYDSENTINVRTLAKLGEKSNIDLRFMGANSKVIIKEERSKKSVEHNKKESEQESTAQDGSNNKT